jgi:hypothetical protein
MLYQEKSGNPDEQSYKSKTKFHSKNRANRDSSNRPKVCLQSKTDSGNGKLVSIFPRFYFKLPPYTYVQLPGTDVMIWKNSFAKKLAKKWLFMLKLLLGFCKKYRYIVFLRKAPVFFVENWLKSLKIVSITLTPDSISRPISFQVETIIWRWRILQNSLELFQLGSCKIRLWLVHPLWWRKVVCQHSFFYVPVHSNIF